MHQSNISKFTRPFTPWMQDMDIKPLKKARHKARYKSSQTDLIMIDKHMSN